MNHAASPLVRRLVLGLGIVALLGGPALALTFTVDSTADGSDTSAGDGACVATTGGCTLRAAMQEANALPDADTIAFDIAGSGVHTIHVVGGQENGSVNAEPGLGAFQPKLAHTLTKGHDRAVEGRDLCAASNTKKAKTRLKQVERAVIQYAHRLSGLPARKKLDEALRQAFLAPAEPLRADTKMRRKGVHCPGDATGG